MGRREQGGRMGRRRGERRSIRKEQIREDGGDGRVKAGKEVGSAGRT